MNLWIGVLCAALFAPFLADAVTRVRADRLERRDLAIWISLSVLAIAAALLSSGLQRTLGLHWFGAAFLTLTLGYGRALLTSAAVAAASSPLAVAGPALLTDALIPVWTTWLLVVATRRWLPPNPFVFLLGCGFFGLFAVSCLQLVLGLGVDALTGATSAEGAALPAFGERLIYGALLASGEATLEGMLITVLVVYAPAAVALFDDRHYLGGAGRS